MAMKTHKKTQWVGQSVPRVDAREKVTGRAQYVDDLDIPGCWHGYIVRSPVSHGKLCGLRMDPDFDWSQVVVATPRDIPGPNLLNMHDRNMPLLAFDEVLYIGEPLAVVAAPTLHLAKEAASHIHPEIEELPALTTLQEAVELFKRNDPALARLCVKDIVKGDLQKGFAEADKIVEAEYTAGHQEQLYIEPQGMVAIPEKDGSVQFIGSLQCPYFVVNELHEALGLKPEQLRVKQAAVGGAFGGKEDFPSMLAGYCALPALKARRPVKIVFDRHQDIQYTPKRHPVWARYKTGIRKDGSICAIEVDFMLDGGAYLTLSDVVMYRGILHAAMGYRCENVTVRGVVCRTHTVPSGAFRGFGAPQGLWGMESQIDKMAAACGIAPHTFRLKNCLLPGDATPTGQILTKENGTPAVLEQALKRSQFSQKLRKCTRGKAKADKWYGIGVSFFAHGAAFTGDGEAKFKAQAFVDLEMLADGKPGATIRVSSTEMGQGAHTVLSQIAADALSVPLDRISFPFADTGLAPNSGPTVASRTTMVVGNTIYWAARNVKEKLEAFAAEEFFKGRPAQLQSGIFAAKGAAKNLTFQKVAGAWLAKHGKLRGEFRFKLPEDIHWDQGTFKGDSYPGYSWGSNVAEVEVDPLTCEIRVTRITACFDIGTVINPVLAVGQVEGGLTQNLGYAVMEKMGTRKGVFDADRMQTYIIPTALDTPEFDITFVEYPYTFAPPGAKGVGEIPMDGLAPAIAAAIEAATGERFTHIPITPEMIFERLQSRKETAR